MMIHKIEPSLLRNVRLLNTAEEIECIVYAHDYIQLKKRLKDYCVKLYQLPFINAFVVRIKHHKIFELSSLSVVKYITQATKVCTCVNVANKILNTQNKRNIPMADFSIAIIDTGIYPHLDFLLPRKKILKFVDLINDRILPYDDNGHGTFVAGVIAGNGTVNKQFVGIDPKSKIIMIKALDKNGETGAGTILNAMQWIYNNKEKYNIRVVSMSFGSAPLGNNDPLKIGAEMLWDSGLVVVTAGGNSGPSQSTIRSPGSSSKVITVGALDDKRIGDEPQYDKFEVAEFSSRGPINGNYKPDMLASGVNINGLNNNIKKGFYTVMSGTSVSAPMVTGIVSIILKQHPEFTPNQVKKYLINCCTSLGSDRNSEGFGWLDGRKLFIPSDGLGLL